MPYDGKSEGRAYAIFPELLNAPKQATNAGKLYARESGGATQLFYLADDGTETQLSPISALNLVTSVFGRTGAIAAVLNDYAASLVDNDSGVAGATVKDALDTLLGAIPAIPVTSVFARTGAVVAVAGDYGSSDITNESGFAGATLTDVLDGYVNTAITDLTNDKADWAIREIAYAGTARDFTQTDIDGLIATSSGSAVTLTIRLDSVETLTLNHVIQVQQRGAGTVTIAKEGGVTLNSLGNLTSCSGQYGILSLWRSAANTWQLTGNLA